MRMRTCSRRRVKNGTGSSIALLGGAPSECTQRTARSSLGVPEHQDHGVPTKEELANEAVLVHWLSLLLPGALGHLGPHLAHILEDHVAVPVERLHTRQDLPVVP